MFITSNFTHNEIITVLFAGGILFAVSLTITNYYYEVSSDAPSEYSIYIIPAIIIFAIIAVLYVHLYVKLNLTPNNLLKFQDCIPNYCVMLTPDINLILLDEMIKSNSLPLDYKMVLDTLYKNNISLNDYLLSLHQMNNYQTT
jgi:hypothetical protein